jgi:hypothetical protein
VIYDLGMSRLAAFATIAVAVGAGLLPIAPAHADPAQSACDFGLTTPAVVDVSGTRMVTVTVTPAGCAVAAAPTLSVACLQVQGSQTAEQCAQKEGPSTAQVYAPYRPGATYVATGRGCSSVGNPPTSVCVTKGPLTTAL